MFKKYIIKLEADVSEVKTKHKKDISEEATDDVTILDLECKNNQAKTEKVCCNDKKEGNSKPDTGVDKKDSGKANDTIMCNMCKYSCKNKYAKEAHEHQEH